MRDFAAHARNAWTFPPAFPASCLELPSLPVRTYFVRPNALCLVDHASNTTTEVVSELKTSCANIRRASAWGAVYSSERLQKEHGSSSTARKACARSRLTYTFWPSVEKIDCPSKRPTRTASSIPLTALRKKTETKNYAREPM